MSSKILLNHIGFKENAKKKFFVKEKPDTDVFTVHYLKDTVLTQIFEGKIEEKTGEDGVIYCGDFSAVTKPGDYVIRLGKYASRQFVIYDGAYDNAIRVLLSYYTYQRCGSELGWYGKCHTDDGIIAETGEHIDLSGGYHQSCDLRKSPGGVSLGVLSMVNTAFNMSGRIAWADKLFTDEIIWAADYYVKTIQPSGAMYNTLNAPISWEAKVFYEHPAPSSAEWNVISILALSAKYLENSYPEKAQKYTKTALKAWDYMMSDKRPADVYKHPNVPLPRGMDPEYFYNMCYKNSASDLGYTITAAKNLYDVTGNESFIKIIEEYANELCKCIKKVNGDYFLFVRDVNSKKSVAGAGSYGHGYAMYYGLLTAIEQLPDSPYCKEWLADLKGLCDTFVSLSKRSCYGKICGIFTEDVLSEVSGHPAPGRPVQTVRSELSGILNKLPETGCGSDGLDCSYFIPKRPITPSSDLNIATILVRASKLFNSEIYASVAQKIIDLLIGGNVYDASHIEAVGYNQAGNPRFGQFFPSVPQLPGAVNIGIGANANDICFDGEESAVFYSEYDMPCVGAAMLLLSEI